MIHVVLLLKQNCITGIEAKGHALLTEQDRESAPCLAVSVLLRTFAETLISENLSVDGSAEQAGQFNLRLAPNQSSKWLAGASTVLVNALRIIGSYYPDDAEVTIEEESDGS